MTGSDRIEHADALQWLQQQEPGAARAVIFDPPYSRGGPMRGREDGMAGQVAALSQAADAGSSPLRTPLLRGIPARPRRGRASGAPGSPPPTT